MGRDSVEIRVLMRKYSLSSLRLLYRSACKHPFLVGLLCFLLFLYKSFPFLLYLLVTTSPVLVCTAVLLGTLLSFGQPNIPEIEEDEEEEAVTHEIAPLIGGVAHDATVVERDLSFSADRLVGLGEDVIEKEEEVVTHGIDVLNDGGVAPDVTVFERDVSFVAERFVVEETVECKSSVETEVSKIDTVFGAFVDNVSLVEEKTQEDRYEKRGVDGDGKLETEGVVIDGEGTEDQYSLIVKGRDFENQYTLVGQGRDDDHDGEEIENHYSLIGEGGDENLDGEEIENTRRPIDSEEEEDEHESSDDEFDGAESSSPDASLADIIPMLDELHLLLDVDASQPAHIPHDDSDDTSERSSSSRDDITESDDEEKETPQRENGGASTPMSWTEDDQKNVMDLGTSEIERNRRLESLIARRHARKAISTMKHKDLIDFSSDLHFTLPHITTARHNQFDGPDDSYADMGLPPIPGSAPSILLPRRNPFDIPYDSSEEKPDLKGDGFEEFVGFKQKESAVFRRHESFSLGSSTLGGHKKERQDNKWRHYFGPESSPEGTSYSLLLQRQLSEISDAKTSFVPDTESVSSTIDQEDMKDSEQDLPQERRFIPSVDHDSSHASQSSDNADSVHIEEIVQSDANHDEAEITMRDLQIHPTTEAGDAATPEELDIREHLKPTKVEDDSGIGSSMSLSKVSEAVFDASRERTIELETKGILAEEYGFSEHLSFEESEFKNMTEALDDGQERKKPVYDSSTSTIDKLLSYTSISSEIDYHSASEEAIAQFADRESEMEIENRDIDIPGNEVICAASSQTYGVDENVSRTKEVVEVSDHDDGKGVPTEVEKDSDYLNELDQLASLNSDAKVHVIVNQHVDENNYEASRHQIPSEDLTSIAQETTLPSLMTEHVLVHPHLSFSEPKPVEEPALNEIETHHSDQGQVYSPRLDAEVHQDVQEKFDVFAVEHVPMVHPSSLKSDHAEEYMLAEEEAIEFELKEVLSPISDANVNADVYRDLDVKAVPQSSYEDTPLEESSPFESEKQPTWSDKSMAEPSFDEHHRLQEPSFVQMEVMDAEGAIYDLTVPVPEFRDQNDINLSEQEFSQERELMPSVPHDSDHVSHESQSSDNADTLHIEEIVQKDVNHDEAEISMGDLQIHPTTEAEDAETSLQLGIEEIHLKKTVAEDNDNNRSSMSLSKVSEVVSDVNREGTLELETMGILAEEYGFSEHLSFEESECKNTTEALDDGQEQKKPYYDSSTSTIDKLLSYTSISSEIDYHSPSEEALAQFADRESEIEIENRDIDIPSNEVICAASPQTHGVDENVSRTKEVVEVSDHDDGKGVPTEVEKDSEYLNEPDQLASLNSDAEVHVIVNQHVDENNYEASSHQIPSEDLTSTAQETILHSLMTKHVSVHPHLSFSEPKLVEEPALDEIQTHRSDQGQIYSPRLYAEVHQDMQEKFDVLAVEHMPMVHPSSLKSDHAEEYMLAEEEAPEFKLKEVPSPIYDANVNVDVYRDLDVKAVPQSSYEDTPLEENSPFESEEQPTWSDKSMAEPSFDEHHRLQEPSFFQTDVMDVEGVIDDLTVPVPEFCDQDDINLSEQEFSQERELMSSVPHDSDHVSHESQSPDNAESLHNEEIVQKDVLHDEAEISIGGLQIHPTTKAGDAETPLQLGIEEIHLNPTAAKDNDNNGLRMSLSKVSEMVSDVNIEGTIDTEMDAILIEESRISDHPSLEESDSQNMTEALDDGQQQEHVYDSVPSPIEKLLSFTSISYEITFNPVSEEAIAQLICTDSEMQIENMDICIPGNEVICTPSSQTYEVDGSVSISREVVNVSDHNDGKEGPTEVEKDYDNPSELDQLTSLNSAAEVHVVVNQNVDDDNSEAYNHQILSQDKTFPSIVVEHVSVVDPHSSLLGAESIEESSHAQIYSPRFDAEDYQDVHEKFDVLIVEHVPMVHLSSLEADHVEEYMLANEDAPEFQQKEDHSSNHDANDSADVHPDLDFKVVSQSSYEDVPLEEKSSHGPEKQPTWSDKSLVEPSFDEHHGLQEPSFVQTVIMDAEEDNVSVPEFHYPEDKASPSTDSAFNSAKTSEYESSIGGEVLEKDQVHASELESNSSVSCETHIPEAKTNMEEDYIQEIDEELLSELDRVGDFYIEKVEPLHAEMIQEGTEDMGELNVVETNLELPAFEARSVEDIEMTFKQLHEGVDIDEVILPSSFKEELYMRNSVGTISSFQVIDARSVEEIHVALNEVFIGNLVKSSEPSELKDGSAEEKVSSSEKSVLDRVEPGAENTSMSTLEKSVDVIDETSNNSNFYFTRARSMDDIQAAVKEVSDGNLGKSAKPLDFKDGLTEVEVAKVSSTENLDSVRVEPEVEEISMVNFVKSMDVVDEVSDNSNFQVTDARSVDDIQVVVKEISDANLGKSVEPFGLAEVEVANVSSITDHCSVRVEPDGEETSTPLLEQSVEGLDERSNDSNLQVVDARTLEDIHVAMGKFSDGNLRNLPNFFDSNDELAEFEASSTEDLDSARIDIDLEETIMADFDKSVDELHDTFENSNFHVIDAKSLDDIQGALEEVSDGNLGKSLVAEFEVDNVRCTDDLDLVRVEPHVGETSMTILDKHVDGLDEASDNSNFEVIDARSLEDIQVAMEEDFKGNLRKSPEKLDSKDGLTEFETGKVSSTEDLYSARVEPDIEEIGMVVHDKSVDELDEGCDSSNFQLIDTRSPEDIHMALEEDSNVSMGKLPFNSNDGLVEFEMEKVNSNEDLESARVDTHIEATSTTVHDKSVDGLEEISDSSHFEVINTRSLESIHVALEEVSDSSLGNFSEKLGFKDGLAEVEVEKVSSTEDLDSASVEHDTEETSMVVQAKSVDGLDEASDSLNFQVIDARYLEDIHAILEEVSDGNLGKSSEKLDYEDVLAEFEVEKVTLFEDLDSSTVAPDIEEISTTISNRSVDEFDEASDISNFQAIIVRSLEDVHVALEKISDDTSVDELDESSDSSSFQVMDARALKDTHVALNEFSLFDANDGLKEFAVEKLSSTKDLDSVRGEHDIEETNMFVLNKFVHRLDEASDSSNFQVINARSLEDIHLAMNEVSEGNLQKEPQTLDSKDGLAEFEVEKVINARSLEDIHVASEKVLDGSQGNSQFDFKDGLATEDLDSAIVEPDIEETIVSILDESVYELDQASDSSNFQVIDSRFIEDTHVALEEVSDGNMKKAPESFDSKDGSAKLEVDKVIDSRSLEDTHVALEEVSDGNKQNAPESLDSKDGSTKLEVDKVIDSRSLEDTHVALEEVSDGNLQKAPELLDSKDGSAELEVEKVSLTGDLNSTKVEPDIEETIVSVLDKSVHGLDEASDSSSFQVIYARILEDIHMEQEEVSDGSLGKSPSDFKDALAEFDVEIVSLTEDPDSSIVELDVEETSLAVYNTSVDGLDEASDCSNFRVINARSLEDIHLALEEVSEGSLQKVPQTLDSKDGLAEFEVDNVSLSDDLDSPRIEPDVEETSMAVPDRYVDGLDEIFDSSSFQVMDARALEDIHLALEEVSEDSLQKAPPTLDSKDGLAEFDVDKVNLCEDLDSSRVEPDIEEISMSILDKSVHGLVEASGTSNFQVIDVKSLEDIHLALEEVSEGSLQKAPKTLDSKDELAEFEVEKVSLSEDLDSSRVETNVEETGMVDRSVDGVDEVSDNSNFQVINARSSEDIHVASEIVSDDNQGESSEPLDSKDESAEFEVDKARSAEGLDSVTVEPHAGETSTTVLGKHVDGLDEASNGSNLQVIDAISIDDIYVALKEVSDGNPGKPTKPLDFKDGLAEVKDDDVSFTVDLHSDKVDDEDTSMSRLDKPLDELDETSINPTFPVTDARSVEDIHVAPTKASYPDSIEANVEETKMVGLDEESASSSLKQEGEKGRSHQ